MSGVFVKIKANSGKAWFMTSFHTALKAFEQSKLSLSELSDVCRQLAGCSVNELEAAQLELKFDYESGKLSAEVFAALDAVLDDRTKLSGPANLSAAVTIAEADDKTVFHDAAVLSIDSAADEHTILKTGSLPSEQAALAIPIFTTDIDLPADHTEENRLSEQTRGKTASLLNVDSLQTDTDQAGELKVGSLLKNRFELQEVLGSGGMGKVFKAIDLRKVEAADKDAYVAIKVLNQDFQANPQALVSLQRESKKAQTLSHPNIIKVYDFDRDGGHVFMSMEYLQGKPLTELIRDHIDQGLPFKQAWPIIRHMAEALAFAHHKNIVHSDFKPGNVFLTENGEVRVLDFGIACAIGRNDHQDNTVFNARDLGAYTPAYASLEQLQNSPPDPRDDIYALACVSYELLTGKHPYGRLSAEKVQELNLQAKPVAQLSRRQWKGLHQALQVSKTQRCASVEILLKALEPRSSLFYGIWTAGILLTVVSVYSLYLSFYVSPKTLNEPPVSVTLSAEQQQKIKDLLDLANIHFDVGYLTAPTGSNALWAYQEVLKIDPYNQSAIDGMNKIADTLEQQAWEAYEKGDRTTALKKIQEGLDVNPAHKGLLQFQEKLVNGPK
jgi:serine/threonine protein kinase